jgi:hypothetical protein
MDNLPTVKIQDGDDYAIINQRDFDPSVHQIYKPPAKTVKRKKEVVETSENSDFDQGDSEN